MPRTSTKDAVLKVLAAAGINLPAEVLDAALEAASSAGRTVGSINPAEVSTEVDLLSVPAETFRKIYQYLPSDLRIRVRRNSK